MATSKKHQIVQLLQSTFMSQTQIAEKVSCHRSYITMIINELGEQKLSEFHNTKMEGFRKRILQMLISKIEDFNAAELKPSNFRAQLAGIERLAKMMGWDTPDTQVNIQNNIQMPSINFGQRVKDDDDS